MIGNKALRGKVYLNTWFFATMIVLYAFSFTSIYAAKETYSIDDVLNKLQERMNKISNFELEGHRVDKKYKYYTPEERCILTEKIDMLFEAASQNGEFMESYKINSSNPRGLCVEHHSAIRKEDNHWLQQDMGSSGSFSRPPGITSATRYDPNQQGILDAHLGLYNHYSFQKVPLVEWSKKKFAENSELTTNKDGKIRIVYTPDKSGYKRVLLVDPSKDFLLYRVECINPKGNLIMASEVIQSKKIENIVVPQKIEFKKCKYINGKEVCIYERTIELDVKTLSPALNSTTFRVDFKARRFWDRRGGFTILSIPEDDIYLDPASFDFTEDSTKLSLKTKAVSQQKTPQKDSVIHPLSATLKPNKKKVEAQNKVIDYANEKHTEKTPCVTFLKIWKYFSILVFLLFVILFIKIITRRAGPPL